MHSEKSKMTIPPPQQNETERSSSELRALDCNLISLCDHVQMEGFNSGAFSDIVVNSMEGSSYNLHRLILSRSPYFRNMLHGPWKESSSPVVTLHVDDKNVNADAIGIALAYLYGHHPKLSDDNAFRVLAAASFLDLQDLCAICTDFIISALWNSNFLAYQLFAENQDYGIHGERVRNACWGYLCQSGAVELKEVLPKLSSQTLHALLTSDELWVSSEEKRLELALHTLIAKSLSCKAKLSESGSSASNKDMNICSDSCKSRGEFDSCGCNMETELEQLNLKDDREACGTADNNFLEQTTRDLQTRSNTEGIHSKQQVQHKAYMHLNWELTSPSNVEQSSSMTCSFSDTNGLGTSSSYIEMPVCIGGLEYSGVAVEGPSEENSCYHTSDNGWLGDKPGQCTSLNSCNEFMLDDWGRCFMPPLSWGGRVVGRRQVKGFANRSFGIRGEEYEAFYNIFEGGSLLFCNMPFEVLLNFRKQLEELGFPCKAINDGLWLQMLLRQRVQEIAADTCKNCCHTSTDCACRQPYGFSHGVSTSYYAQEHGQNNAHGSMGNVYVAESAQSGGNGPFRPVRVHVRGPNDGLAGIGRGAAFVPTGGWPPTRFVYSRVPFSVDNRNGQLSLANDDSDGRVNHGGDNPGDGLTALVGLTQGGSDITNFNEENSDGRYAMELPSRLSVSSSCGPSTSAIPVQMVESSDRGTGNDSETPSNSISLDTKTPLSDFPPFRFGVEFEDLHRLCDGQVKHSPEFFYAGSLWKVSVQAFYDEDPQGRRTLGMFLHRRKAEISESSRKVHMYIDSREKVRARFQLICPSKREVMVFGSSKQRGTPLPKAPKGWGWRTALLFDELPDLLQNGALRVAAIVQLV